MARVFLFFVIELSDGQPPNLQIPLSQSPRPLMSKVCTQATQCKAPRESRKLMFEILLLYVISWSCWPLNSGTLRTKIQTILIVQSLERTVEIHLCIQFPLWSVCRFLSFRFLVFWAELFLMLKLSFPFKSCDNKVILWRPKMPIDVLFHKVMQSNMFRLFLFICCLPRLIWHRVISCCFNL